MSKASENKGFRTPDRFFEQFPDRLLERVKNQKAPGDMAGQGFRVPEGYFESLSDRLQERMVSRDRGVRRLWPPRLAWIGAAAAAITLLLVLLPGKQATVPEFRDLNGEAIAEYLQTREWDMSSQELAETLPLGEIAMEDVLETAPGADQIMDYLEIHTESEDEFYLDNND